MKSRLRLVNPALLAALTALRACFELCARPRALSISSERLWTPRLRRFTPRLRTSLR